MSKNFDVDAYEEKYLKRCEATKEIKEFLKENPMSYAQLIDYARYNNKKEWQKAIRSGGCGWLRSYCLDGKHLIKRRT